ncbi:hypothetical protein [Flavobacterium algicola]|uniref:hypothetical protein n=1 Tax=Flavobacterium algicola TaxID=556529 RepID=UPI001EFC4E90|nr:hypothetical protein [Flavobacterium algicola]MCG9793462.1 hypothetical protein [Flavobacterium algicola]
MQESNQKEEDRTAPYLGDLDKTNTLLQLVQIPQEERDENWSTSFLSNLSKASFCCGEPQIITGPDGFPYFQLFLPEPNKSFQCFVIENMKDDFLLESGFGVVINPTDSSADWVLSHGDILNLHLNNSFYITEKTPFSKDTNDETISENEEVIIGQPSEKILPRTARKLLREYLKLNGVDTPKVVLLMRHQKDDKKASQDLVFNVTPNNFENAEHYRIVMQTMAWYLPRHYSFVGMDEKSLGNGFEDL